jgi:hypothetical protein
VTFRATLGLVALCGLLGMNCRGFHESAIKHRLVLTRFVNREVQRSWQDVDALLVVMKPDAVRTWCNLCVISAETTPDKTARRYCLSSQGENACVLATPASPGTTRFAVAADQSSTVIRALWVALEPDVAARAELIDADELAAIAQAEEDAFVPRWTFLAGAKAGAVVSYDPPTFTFGGQAGFRYWGSRFVLPGAALEVENMLQGGRSLVTSNLQGRIELALWDDANARFANLPRLTFLMSAGPLVGWGNTPALGGRATLGIHLLHLGTFVTPFFFELGFQVLDVDEQSATGLRIALGLGF